jgi:hypothetical protein
VDTTLRFLIERVGGVEGAYPNETPLPDDFLKRRTAGNVIEALGIVAFRASPVWVLAALADVCGMGRQLIPEIAASLKEQNLLDKDRQFASVDQILDGLEGTSSRLAESINTPPLDVPTLRQEWHALREEARNLAPSALPSRDTITSLWTQLQAEAARQQRSVFETSSMLAVSAVKGLPDNARWLSASALVGASKNRPDRRGRTPRSLSRDTRRHPSDRVCHICGAAAWPLRARGRRALLIRAHHVDRTLSRSIHERTLVMRRSLWSTTLGMVLAAAVLVAQGPAPATRVSPDTSRASSDTVVPGELVIEPATLINLGFEWFIQGDANRNASVDVAFRKKGSEPWRPALPLLRLQGERIYAESRVDLVAPNMFAGSVLDLEPGTSYEVRLTMTDSDGVQGERSRVVSVSTRPEPQPYAGGRVFHVYPPGHTGQKSSRPLRA